MGRAGAGRQAGGGVGSDGGVGGLRGRCARAPTCGHELMPTGNERMRFMPMSTSAHELTPTSKSASQRPWAHGALLTSTSAHELTSAWAHGRINHLMARFETLGAMRVFSPHSSMPSTILASPAQRKSTCARRSAQSGVACFLPLSSAQSRDHCVLAQHRGRQQWNQRLAALHGMPGAPAVQRQRRPRQPSSSTLSHKNVRSS